MNPLQVNVGLNAAFAAATNLLGIRNDPYLAFNFFVEIEGLLVGGFSEVTGLQIETEVEEYREGGQNGFIHKLAGATRYPSNVTLKHGLTAIESLWSWHQDVVKRDIERKNVTIYLLDQQRIPIMWWNIESALPVKWIGPDFNAESNSIAVESVELVHQGISKPELSSVASIARGAVSGAVQLF